VKAISVRQPWAWCITNAGKCVENRTWNTDYRGPVLIHAAKRCTMAEYVDWSNSIWNAAPYAEAVLCSLTGHDLPDIKDMPRGGFVARASIVGCVHASDKHLLSAQDKLWFFGPYGFVLSDVEPIPFVPYLGALGLFNVPDDLIKEAA
jgi:hypothetical protein